MTKPSFTPGPWQWVGDNEIEQVEQPFATVAEVMRLPRNTDPDQEQRNANSSLIASAPELFGALEDVVALYQNVAVNVLGLNDEELSDHLRKADAALAKARGE